MQFYGKCLIVVADGENARLWEPCALPSRTPA